MQNRPIVLIDNYDSFSYNLYQLIQIQTDCPVVVYRNDAIALDILLSMMPKAIVISPGPGHPQNEKDFGICKPIITDAEKLNCPILGVCLGHQGIAYHLGGQIISAPGIMHGKTSQISITLNNTDKPLSPLFEGLDNPFEAMRYHSLLIDEATLPDCLAVTARDCSQKLPMAIQHKTLPLFGIQFHPESIGTPAGSRLIANFLKRS
ncbi:MAG: aminodeoxychorismate/anthranilate synthase component II [Cyanobacteria bacterium P01_H01_bin.74]